MPESTNDREYIDIDELLALTGLSRATIWRLKRAGKIPFYQPAGKGGRVKFPKDAIELAEQSDAQKSTNEESLTSPGQSVAQYAKPGITIPRSALDAFISSIHPLQPEDIDSAKQTSKDECVDPDEERRPKLPGPRPRWRRRRD